MASLKVDGVHYRSIWLADDGRSVEIIDQTRLPHELARVSLSTLEDAAAAIKGMQVRGAPLIGATAAYGVCLAIQDDAGDGRLDQVREALMATRPTAVNLRWALDEMVSTLKPLPEDERVEHAYVRAGEICDTDVETNEAIGDHGLGLIRELSAQADESAPFNVLTHCNAGWLATVDWGTALSPIYKAHDSGLPVHVWVDETRPRNQGASLTAWELGQHGVPYTVIADNAGGHLMQSGMVDMCIVGSDRTTSIGDVCNKIGTYLKALSAYDNGVPFYVAVPSPTIDWDMEEGVGKVPIEERDPSELSTISGLTEDGEIVRVSLLPPGSAAANYAFDVTPGKYVSGLITERGVCSASRDGLARLFPERS